MNFRLTLLWSAVLVAMPLTLLGTSPMGLVNVSVACMREEPRHGAELVSQALMGTPVRLLEPAQGGEWWRVQSPDGYEAYMIGNSLVVCDSARYAVWKSSPRLVVTALAQTAVTEGAAGGVVSDLVNGCVLEGSMSPADSVCRVTLPDGRTGIDRKSVV